MDTLKSKLATTSEIKFEYSFGKFFGYSAILSDVEIAQIRTDERSVDFVEKTIEMHTQTVGDTQKMVNLYPNGESPDAKKACVVQREATWGLDRVGERALLIDGLFNHDNDAGRGVDAYIVDTGTVHFFWTRSCTRECHWFLSAFPLLGVHYLLPPPM
jgi:hypothetical protein